MNAGTLFVAKDRVWLLGHFFRHHRRTAKRPHSAGSSGLRRRLTSSGGKADGQNRSYSGARSSWR